MYIPTGRQIAAARTLLGWKQPELAEKANISVPTLKRMEASEGPVSGMANNVKAVLDALAEGGAIPLESGGIHQIIEAKPGVARAYGQTATVTQGDPDE